MGYFLIFMYFPPLSALKQQNKIKTFSFPWLDVEASFLIGFFTVATGGVCGAGVAVTGGELLLLVTEIDFFDFCLGLELEFDLFKFDLLLFLLLLESFELFVALFMIKKTIKNTFFSLNNKIKLTRNFNNKNLTFKDLTIQMEGHQCCSKFVY